MCNTNFFLQTKKEYLSCLDNEYKKNIIRNRIKEKLRFFNIGISDIIEKCDNTTNSSDNGIIRETLAYNQELPKLICNADTIILNGQGRTKKEFDIAVELKNIDLSQKKVITVISSSSVANRYYKEREQMWKNII